MATPQRVESPHIAVLTGFAFQVVGGIFLSYAISSANGTTWEIVAASLIITVGSTAMLIGCIAAGVEWGNRRTP